MVKPHVAKCIVDTSVWIDFFKGSLSAPINSFLEEAIPLTQVVITDIIFHEILMGALSKREYQKLEGYFSLFEVITISKELQNQFNQFAWKLHREGLPGKYTDLSIAFFSHHHKYPLLSFDKYFEKIAQKKFIELIC